ncbi:hypothetical protein LP421_21175 [Rhizobium sp. RCAM05350]|nr:hypothetical protein LP421_21175 [Rhizobium sp. RCAM05350]
MPAIGCNSDAQPVLLQVARNQLVDFAIVIDDQDVINVIHVLRFLSGP